MYDPLRFKVVCPKPSNAVPARLKVAPAVFTLPLKVMVIVIPFAKSSFEIVSGATVNVPADVPDFGVIVIVASLLILSIWRNIDFVIGVPFIGAINSNSS